MKSSELIRISDQSNFVRTPLATFHLVVPVECGSMNMQRANDVIVSDCLIAIVYR